MHRCPSASPKPKSRQTSKYYIITRQRDDNVKIETDRFNVNIYYNVLILNRTASCLNHKPAPFLIALNALSIILLRQMLPFFTYCNFHLFHCVNSVMATTKPSFQRFSIGLRSGDCVGQIMRKSPISRQSFFVSFVVSYGAPLSIYIISTHASVFCL